MRVRVCVESDWEKSDAGWIHEHWGDGYIAKVYSSVLQISLCGAQVYVSLTHR